MIQFSLLKNPEIGHHSHLQEINKAFHFRMFRQGKSCKSSKNQPHLGLLVVASATPDTSGPARSTNGRHCEPSHYQSPPRVVLLPHLTRIDQQAAAGLHEGRDESPADIAPCAAAACRPGVSGYPSHRHLCTPDPGITTFDGHGLLEMRVRPNGRTRKTNDQAALFAWPALANCRRITMPETSDINSTSKPMPH